MMLHTKTALMTILSTLLISLLITIPQANAGTVKGLNKNLDRIIIKLNRRELANVQAGNVCILSVGKENFIVTGSISKIDPLKATALIYLDEASDIIKRGQQVTFLPLRWTFIHSPALTLSSQQYQLDTPIMEGGMSITRGIINETTTTYYDAESLEERSAKQKNEIERTHISFLYAQQSKDKSIGGSIELHSIDGVNSYEESDQWRVENGSLVDTSDTSYNEKFGLGHIKPQLWYQIEESWRLGLGVNHYLLSYKFSQNSSSARFTLEADQAIASVLYVTPETEFGFWYNNRTIRHSLINFKDASGSLPGSTLEVRIPAELEFFYRGISDASSIWSGGFGYTFWERDDGNDNLSPAAKPYELITLRVTNETRLESGNKIDVNVEINGAKTMDPFLKTQDLNTLGVQVIYRQVINPTWSWGVDTSLKGGIASVQEDEEAVVINGVNDLKLEDVSRSGGEISIGLLTSMTL